MKISLYKFRYAALAWFLCLLAGCQQDEIMQQNQQREHTTAMGSVASRSVTCEVTTTEAGTLMAKLDEIASSGGYSKEDITDLTISGPVNREDLRALRPFQYITELDMTNLNIIDENGEKTDYFPDSVLDSLQSPAHVYMPVSINIIGNNAFKESNVVAVEMSDNITNVYSYAFTSCKNLHTVKLSNNIEELWYGVFENCTSLTTINTPEKLKKIHGAAFNGCAFSSFSIPESVEIIEWTVFANNPNLETIHWPSKFTTIPGSCFENCPKLKFEIPNHITSIENNAFAGCTMSTFVIPEDVEYIGASAFCRNPNLVSVTLPSTLTNVGDYAFANCGKLQSINGISNWTKMPNGIFENCKELKMDIPLQIDTIGDYAFQYCELLTVPSLKELKYLGHHALYCCKSLTDFSTSTKLQFIGDEALYGCEQISRISLPETLTQIGYHAFGNTSIKELTIPSSVQAIGRELVAGCDNIEVIYWNTTADMPQLFYSWENHNTLIYAKAGINYNTNNKNLIFGDDENGYTIEKIEINADKDFYCPKAFTAKEIVYRKYFYCGTNPDRAGGWQTIALPFTVTRFAVQANGEQPERELKPFGTEDMGDAKPFWLRTLHNDGFERETILEAGKPYIIAFPNNPTYYLPEYNIWGTIEFWGENVTVITNTQLTPIVGTAYTFQPTFKKLKKSMDIYNIDHNGYTDRMYNIYYEGGSLFRSSIRDTEPFESYLTNNVNGRSVIPISNTSSSRSVKKMGIKPMEDDM